MSLAQIVPYNALSMKDWTIQSLFADLSQDGFTRIQLSDLVQFNKHKFDEKLIQTDLTYSYIEISSVSPTTCLIESPQLLSGSEITNKKRAKLIAHKGDILISTVRPERGICAIVPTALDGAIVSNGFAVLTPRSLRSELLFFLLRAARVLEELSGLAKGAAIPTLTLKELKEYKLPISEIPTDMETEVVRLFSQWEAQQSSVNDLSSIINDVFINESLVKEATRVNKHKMYDVVSYSNLIDRFDVEFLLPTELAMDTWKYPAIQLKHIVEDMRTGQQVNAKDITNQGIPFIRVQDLSPEKLKVSHEISSYISESEVKIPVSAGQLLITRVGGLAGKSALVPKELEGAAINQHLIRVSLNHSMIPAFVCYFLKSKWGAEQLATITVGSAQQFLQLSSLYELLIPNPPLEVQLKVVEAIERILIKQDVEELRIQFQLMPFQLECLEVVTQVIETGAKKIWVELPIQGGTTRTLNAILSHLFHKNLIKSVLHITEGSMIAKQICSIMRDLFPEKECDLLVNVGKADCEIIVATAHEINDHLISKEEGHSFDLIVYHALTEDQLIPKLISDDHTIHLALTKKINEGKKMCLGIKEPTYSFHF